MSAGGLAAGSERLHALRNRPAPADADERRRGARTMSDKLAGTMHETCRSGSSTGRELTGNRPNSDGSEQAHDDGRYELHKHGKVLAGTRERCRSTGSVDTKKTVQGKNHQHGDEDEDGRRDDHVNGALDQALGPAPEEPVRLGEQQERDEHGS